MLPIILETTVETERTNFIEEFLAKHLISPYNLFTYEPDNKEVSIKQIREIISESSVSSSEPRLFHILRFDTASAEAQNAFLKTLEEHQPNLYYILSVENSGQLLATIRSRSQVVSLSRKKLRSASDNVVRLLDQIIKGDLKSLFELTSQSSFKSSPEDLIDSLLFYFRDRLTNDTKAGIVLKEILAQRSLFLHNHVDPQTTLDKILITVHKTYVS